MEKILEYFNDNNIDFLKLGLADFCKSENTLSLTFLYDEINYDKLNENREKIKDLTKKYINLDINYNIKFAKAFLDEDRLKTKIKEYLKNEHIANYYCLKNIDVKQSDNLFDVKLYMSLSSDEIDKTITNILNYLTSLYFYKFNFSGIRINENFNELEEHKSSILDNLKAPVKLNKMKVNKLENIIGEINEMSCYPYEYYSTPEENVYLCGHILNIEPIEFTKKDGETKGLRYALTIKCLDKTFKASLFPTKKNLETCKTIETDVDVMLFGSLDSFNNDLTLKVKSLAKCVIEDYQKPSFEVNKEYKDYRKIYPQKYEEISQINLFDQKIDKEYLSNNEFVVFDFETTGLEYMVDHVTEIGACKIKNGKIIETFTTLINPQKNISKEITEKTGITNEMVKNSPLFEDVVPDFYKFCKGCILVGQNVDFDYGFLDYYGRKANYIFDNKKEDTLTLARKYIFLKNYKLKTIADYLSVSLINAHRALNDALATAKVFIKIIEKYC